MKLFRFHKGGLNDSLATTIEVKNFEEIKQFMLNIFNSPEKFCIFSTPALNEHLSLDFKK